MAAPRATDSAPKSICSGGRESVYAARPMGMFATLMSKVFGHKAPETPAAAVPAPAAPAAPAPVAAPVPTPVAAPVAPVPLAEVDVTAILDDMAANSGEDLDWQKSIVDLMKVVGMDSSLHARQELAKDLNYSGDLHDSASMNIWLHKEVLTRFAANGGKLPSHLV
jgi:3-oxoacyl-ACP reductase-like protein